MNKKLTYAGVAALLLLVISGCGDKPAAAPADEAGQNSPTVVSGAEGNNVNGDSKSDSNSNAGGLNTPATAEPVSTDAPVATDKPVEVDKQSQSISTYYTDSQQMELVKAAAKINFANDTEKYTEAFKTLQNSDKADMIPLWSGIELKSLKFTDGQILMDIHKPAEAQLGAGGESMAISALAQLFFQFEEVKSVELLVDGEQVESLMGHVDLVHPITRENSAL
ncbi:GerMN domain-containing protein [Paenibacillus sp. IHBB 3054]|uniref:GerMN domain-containing protein n=1 Tax=Paenibacillus sp. IHBB 3054 TaxID=3425689 RepID=UPI003F681D59